MTSGNISNFYAAVANIERAALEGAAMMRVREVRPTMDRHLLGIGTAIAVFLVLSLVKLGAFFAVHTEMLRGPVASDGATVRTADNAVRQP